MKKPFISPEEALRRLMDAAAALPAPAAEQVPLDEAVGRIAAENVCARFDQPPFDRSPLDGYALRSADLTGASAETPVRLPVSLHLFAGDAADQPLPDGTAARIMTGAPIPAGADCVIMQELTDCGEETAAFYKTVPAGGNICRRGEDVAAGAALIAAGDIFTPAHIGVLGGQGIASVLVTCPPSVAVLSTGSELLPAGAAWQPGKIYDANGAQAVARLRQCGFAAVREICADEPETIAARLRALLRTHGAVITTGGVSVGQKDHLPAVVEMLGGQVLFHGVAQKPGSPMLAALIEGKLLFCLSGNPFAAAATFEQYALPALLRAAGRAESGCLPRRASLTLTSGFAKASGGRRFLRAKAAGAFVALPGDTNTHASGNLAGMLDCNCFVDIPAGSAPLAPGQQAEVVYFV